MAYRWKCGRCGADYDLSKWLRLKRVPLEPTDVSPALQHGYTSQCKCGYVFGRDRWRIEESVTLAEPPIKVTVSTAFVEVSADHFWFETTVVSEDPSVECRVCWRYKTQQEAEMGHAKVVNALKEGKYEIKPERWILLLRTDEW